MTKKYQGDDIVVLEGLEPVRKRPGMYIGGVGMAGLHHMIWEVVDNSVDEAMNGHATEITVTLHKDGRTVTVSDNGRGIPVDRHSKTKKSALETVLTVLHAGGKFDGNNYKTAGGLHGVGASVVNALSKELTAVVRREGAQYRISFAKGKATSKLQKLKGAVRGSGTTITFDQRFSQKQISTVRPFLAGWRQLVSCIAAKSLTSMKLQRRIRSYTKMVSSTT